MDLSRETEFAITSVVEAAKLLTPYLSDDDKRSDSTRRKAAGEIVTEADHKLNDFLIERILEAFPEDAICAEEGSPHDDPQAERRWIIDPIDGTRSFVKGRPGFSVMLALAIKGEPALGVVHQPLEERTWYAVKGGGVHLRNGAGDQRIEPEGNPPRLIWSPYALEERGEALKRELGIAELIHVESFGLRAAAMAVDGAGVFASRPGSPHLWDTASAWVIVHEAGGVMTGYDGNPLSYWQSEETMHPHGAVASKGVDHARVVALIGKYLPAM